MNTMLDPRALIPILYDPAALSILQQQNPSFFSSIQKNVGNSTTSPSTGSFRIHDLLESSTKSENNPILGNSATASAMFAQMMNANFANFKSGILTGINSDKANSSGENDSLLDDLEGNQSSFSPRSSSAESPPPNERSTDRASNCSTSSVGGPIHGKKARKARTIFTDKQLQELENTFERQKYLSVQDRVDLAHRMGLSDTQVKTWYQNRRTKWKRQAAVGVDLLQEASNMAAVQNLLRTSPYWNQFTRSFFGQEHFLRGMAPMGTSMNPGFPGMMMPPGMIPPGMPPFNTFSMNHANFSGISEKSSESVKLSKTDESSKKESPPSSESSKNDES